MGSESIYLLIYGGVAPNVNSIENLGSVEVHTDFRDAVRALLAHIQQYPELFNRCRMGAEGDEFERELDTLRTWMQEGMLGSRAHEFRSTCSPVRIVPVPVQTKLPIKELLRLPHTSAGEGWASPMGNGYIASYLGATLVDVRRELDVARESAITSLHRTTDGITQEDVRNGVLVAQLDTVRMGVAVRGEHTSFAYSLSEAEQIIHEVAGPGVETFYRDLQGTVSRSLPSHP